MQVQICLSDNMHLLGELVSKLSLSLIYSISTNLFERGKTSLFKFGKNQFSIHHYFKWSCKKHIHNKGTIIKQLTHCWKFKNCPLSKKKGTDNRRSCSLYIFILYKLTCATNLADNICFRDIGLDLISQFPVAWGVPSGTAEW